LDEIGKFGISRPETFQNIICILLLCLLITFSSAKLLGTHQIPLEAFLVVLRAQQVDDVDADEVACILANLIYQGKIKGYISHQHQKLVVSKQNPFPALYSLT
jgi:hypothetical protein